MSRVGYIHISLELWGCIFCFIALTCIAVEKEINPKGSFYFMLIEFNNAMLLLFDSFAY